MRKEIGEHIERQPERATLGEIIIRDLQRMDAFPDIDEHDVGASAWSWSAPHSSAQVGSLG